MLLPQLESEPMTQQRKSSYILFLIFAASGFSGLIYETIWTHYLKLFLGHAAYAQTLVLAIFMGGLAIGSWICSRYSLRWKNLLLGYAAAEAAIGLFALLFHTVFDQAVQFSYASVIPHLGSAATAYAYKWILSSLMILPQSILLGMTFPLMSAGIIRLFPGEKGKTIALLYFTNSLGAAVGVVISGFFMVRVFGLPWTIRIAGLINIFLALAVWSLATKPESSSAKQGRKEEVASERSADSHYCLLLFVAFLTGSASFIYEIGWIRMLNLVMGSSTHAFELMLSAFILGLAAGGFWIQRRIDDISVPERFLAYIQVAMGLLALATLPLYGRLFDVMRLLLKALDKTDSGYLLFNLSSSAISLAVMLPATFCAGMTLPLITFALLKNGEGERSIGSVYAANTVGAIIGVFFATHIGMPYLGLKGLIGFGAGCDIALGTLLFWRAAGYASARRPAIITGIGFCALAATLLLVKLDPYRMASGVYRTGMLLYPQLAEVLSNEDGKTATISTYLEKGTGVVSIATNGKPDASLGVAPGSKATPDEPTMILLGILPMALNPTATTVANIGLGSGLTTHTLLGNPALKTVDTVEIEKSVLGTAKFFRPRVYRAYDDPRSHIFIDDAKTFFSVNNKQYDIIISEPSNPWVSGVAGLFSEEFYRQMNRHLSQNGIFAQWVQLYEIDTELVISILKAVDNNFSDFVVYATNDQDMLIVAKKNGELPPVDPRLFGYPEISAALARIDIHGEQDLEVRKLGSKKFLKKLLAAADTQANSDYYPIVDQNAARTRFLLANATDLHDLTQGPIPSLEILTKAAPFWRATDVTASPFFAKSQMVDAAMALRDYCLLGRFDTRHGDIPSESKELALQLRRIFYQCGNGVDQVGRQMILYNAAINMIPFLRPEELEAVWNKLEAGPCAGSLSVAEKNWMGLFRAVSRRDAKGMVYSAKAILDSRQQMPPVAVEFVVASSMLGSLVQGDQAGGKRLWAAYRPFMFKNDKPDMLFRLLVAETTTPQ
jgi:predicted membrane-bound spermidine synthase